MSNTFELAAGNKRSLILELPQLEAIWHTKPVGIRGGVSGGHAAQAGRG